MIGECGIVFTTTLDKISRNTIITPDVLDTVNILGFSNLFRNTDTIFISR